MDLLLVNESRDGTYVEVRRAKLRHVLAAYLGGVALDRRLAAGAAPDSSPALALRARMLRRMRMRRALGERLREIVREAERPRAALSSRIPISAANVTAARRELLELADRLLCAEPVAVRGVARVRVLLSDGLSPVYWRADEDDLPRVVRLAIDQLDPELSARAPRGV